MCGMILNPGIPSLLILKKLGTSELIAIAPALQPASDAPASQFFSISAQSGVSRSELAKYPGSPP